MKLNTDTNGGVITKRYMTTYMCTIVDEGLTWNERINNIKTSYNSRSLEQN